MDGTALQRCFLMDGPAPCRNGPVRVATLFTMDGTPLKRLLDYGQGHISTLFSMDGSAPKHSLLWAGPHRARTKTFITMGGPALLWAGPHQDRTGPAAGPHYYGRARTGTLITMGGPAAGPHSYGRARHTVWTLQSNFQKVWGRRPPPQCKASVVNLHKSDNIVSQACAQKV